MEISELCLLPQILTEVVTPDIKRTRNELREKLEGSDMRYQKKKKKILILPYTQEKILEICILIRILTVAVIKWRAQFLK